MAKKITTTKVKVRGQSFWQVRWHDESGKPRRKFLAGKAAADAFAAEKRGETLNIEQKLLTVPADDRERMLFVWNEAKRKGIDLVSIVSGPAIAPATSKTLGDAITEILEAKTKAARAKKYLKNLRLDLTSFAKGRESLDTAKIGFRDVEAWLDSKGQGSRSTYRSRLSTLFKFCVRRGYRTDNPCDRLEVVRITKKSPHIFTIKQIASALKWLNKNPKLLAWFALSTFAGLRPEEAQKSRWKDINFKENWIKVEAQTTKVRQRRVVNPLPVAMKWLKIAKRRKSKLPLTEDEKRKQQEKLRKILGFERWPQDITRHSASSYWLAATGEAAKIATALAHSESVMRRDYMALVTKVEAAKFAKL